MNFLAHLYLAGDSPDAWIGALLGDFARGVRLEELPVEVREGVELHWRIDAFTDAHPTVGISKRRIEPPYRRYAPVLVDVFYDHFLARHWRRYSPEPLEVYAGRVYSVLAQRRNELPERMARAAHRMAEQDWLTSYAEIEGIRRALRRMSTRLRRENLLATGAEPLAERYAELEADFNQFFPEVVEYVRSLR